MNNNIKLLIPTKPSLMTTIIVTDKASTKIVSMKYKSEYATNKLLSLLRLYKNTYQEYKNLKKITKEPDQLLSIFSKKLTPLGTSICHIITSLTEFRSVYNMQFPKKAKPKKFITTKHQYLFKDHTDHTIFHSEISIDFTLNFYDIFSRIEKILGTKLIYNQEEDSIHEKKTLLPIEFFEKVVFINPVVAPQKPFIKLIPIKQTSDFVLYKKHNNHTYHRSCFTQVYTASDLSTSKSKFAWENYTIKKCVTCERPFEYAVSFYYNKLHDEKTCAVCFEEANKYSQPRYSLENITNNQYHSNRLGFKFSICKLDNENSIPIGMELETELKIKDYKATKSHIAFALWNALDRKDIVFERDGSLNTAGIEIITNPMTLEYARKYWEHGKLALANLTNGIYSGLPEYKQADDESQFWGIHLTTSRKYWTDVSIIKLQNFLFNRENKSFLQMIAQRTHNYGGSEIGTKGLGKTFYIDKSKESNRGEKIVGTNRNTSVNITKSKLIEFRFFQSSNDTNIILKNYDFITALNLWLTTQPTELHPKYMDFLNWLNNPVYIKRFKYLIKYLKQPYYTIRRTLSNELESQRNTITLFNDIDLTKFWKKEDIKCA